MVAPEATKRPVPMEPPMAIMDRCRALSSRLSAVGAAFLELSAAMDVSIGGSDPARPLAGAGAGMQNRKNKRAAVSRPHQGACTTKRDRKSTRLNSSHSQISYAVFCLKK